MDHNFPPAAPAQYLTWAGDTDVTAQRHEAYADEYVELTPKGTRKALLAESGGEIHYSDGGVVRLAPGDFAVESANGRLIRATAAEVLAEFDIGDRKVAKAAKEAAEAPESVAAAAVEFGRSRYGTLEDADRAFNEERIPFAGSAPVADSTPLEPSAAELRALMETQAATEVAATQAVAGNAVASGLISAEEGANWVATGTPPEGVTVNVTPDGTTVDRAAGLGPAGAGAEAGPDVPPGDVPHDTVAKPRRRSSAKKPSSRRRSAA